MKVMLRARAETEKQKNEIYEVMGLIADRSICRSKSARTGSS